jgi:Sel1 repeat
MYLNGKGVSQDYKQAFEWYRKAAEQGNMLAQSQLGYMYGGGLGIPKDSGQALQWYGKAAERGYAHAQCALGTMYESADGVTRDDRQAMDGRDKPGHDAQIRRDRKCSSSRLSRRIALTAWQFAEAALTDGGQVLLVAG